MFEAKEREKAVGQWSTRDLVSADCVIIYVFDAAIGSVDRVPVVRGNNSSVGIFSIPDLRIVTLSTGGNDKWGCAVALNIVNTISLLNHMIDSPFHVETQYLPLSVGGRRVQHSSRTYLLQLDW